VRVAYLAVAIALLVALSSCGSSQALRHPVDDVLVEGTVNLSDQDKGVLYRAEEILVSRCMNKEGFQYLVFEGFSKKKETAPSLYSSEDVAERARHGYGLAARKDQSHDLDANGRYVSTLSSFQRRQYDEALLGSLKADIGQVRLLDGTVVYFTLSGCVASARTKLYGDNKLFMETTIFVENLRSEVERRVLADPRYLVALDLWRQCMNLNGYVVENPAAAVELASRGGQYRRSEALASKPPNEKEIAVADANCSKRAQLTVTGKTLDREHEAKLIVEQRRHVDIFAQILQSSLPKARKIVES
jgi:hypothetical protein